jgi:hypothetical protein
MGCLALPTTLEGWARYCDCLETFKPYEAEPSEPSEQTENHS